MSQQDKEKKQFSDPAQYPRESVGEIALGFIRIRILRQIRKLFFPTAHLLSQLLSFSKTFTAPTLQSKRVLKEPKPKYLFENVTSALLNSGSVTVAGCSAAY